MITFERLGRLGRMGNQLFQIASTIGIAERCGNYAAFPQWKYQSYFANPLPVTFKHSGTLVKEPHFHYADFDLTSVDHYILDGYFQSYKYFEGYESLIKEQFEFNADFKGKVFNQNKSLFEKRTIAIHVRRGDYVGNQAHYNLPIGYYISAIESIQGWQECNLVFFSDDYDYIQWHFSCLPNAYFPKGNEAEDLCLMTMCDDFIIANSSFSWWGAWLGEKYGSRVIRPANHFNGTLLRHDIKDLFPPNWIKHSVEKPDLTDVTFVIPVHYDHKDREENLNIVTRHLHHNFETHISIGEQGGNHFKYVINYASYFPFLDTEFWRTKMINTMCHFALTDIVVNYDADVVINPVQLWYSVILIRSGFDIVYPYDGTFNHVHRAFVSQLNSGHECLVKTKHLASDRESFGGCLLMKKESYIRAGGENENFISFGPEDAERYNRFIKLGLKVKRVGGALYHIDHYRGINSSKKNKHIDRNRAEWHKVRLMTKDELIQYVNTWNWLK